LVVSVRLDWQRANHSAAIDSERLRLAQFQQPVNSVFDLRAATIPRKQIRSGGPPKDGIPALSDPAFLSANAADFLQADDRVIGVTIDGKSRAYPIRILSYHEIINDRIADVPIAVTFCPLCDSAIVFDRRTPIGEREFGVSGLLFNSNVLMYDRGGQPESLWSQMDGRGVSGPAAGKKLETLPMQVTTWKSWIESQPESEVLSNRTGHARDYSSNPYDRYFKTQRLMFPVDPMDQRLPTKTPILGLWEDGGAAAAFPILRSKKSRAGEPKTITGSIGGRSFTIEMDFDSQTARVIESDEGVHWLNSLWFAWAAFRPGTRIIQPK